MAKIFGPNNKEICAKNRTNIEEIKTYEMGSASPHFTVSGPLDRSL